MNTIPLSIRLSDYANLWRSRPFDWSRANCAQFGAGWVEKIEGRNPLASLAAISCARSALRLIAEFGTMKDAVTLQLDREPIDHRLARLGDIVILPHPLAESMDMVGICNGRTALVLWEGRGVGGVEMTDAKAAWRLIA